ncbi:Alpha/Beta hydrolase protein [Melanogaster broomeanus]|nr:Alpha/Beta hydrolase protein [Melanogaster broomeanus]
MALPSPESVSYYHHGKFTVAGGTLPYAITAYQTYGDPANPCILAPTCYGTRLDLLSETHLVGEGKALDTRKYFVVLFGTFGSGESTSPSNTPAPLDGPRFPYCSYEDNVRAQKAVVDSLGVKKVHCVVGYSMGGQQAYYWAVMYPGFVERIVVICSASRTSTHNKCVLEGPKYALLASKDFEDGEYKSQPQYGIRAFGRSLFCWALDSSFYREKLYTMDGAYPTAESFYIDHAETFWLQYWDANDMLTVMNTWQRGDVSQLFDGDLEKALGSISARVLLMPSRTDPLFRWEDNEIEVSLLPRGELSVIDSLWGHFAGSIMHQPDVELVSRKIAEFLN